MGSSVRTYLLTSLLVITMIFLLFVSFILWILWSVCCFFVYHKSTLSGKRVLITGGSSGIGRCLALRLVQLGANVTVWDDSKEKLELLRQDARCIQFGQGTDTAASKNTTKTAAASISNDNGSTERLSTVCLDLASRLQLQRSLKQMERFDVVVNAFDPWTTRGFFDCTDETSERIIQSGSVAALTIARACLPSMMRSNNGHFVTIANVAGVLGSPEHPDYAASQWAVIGAHESIQMMLRQRPDCRKVYSTLVCVNVERITLDPGSSRIAEKEKEKKNEKDTEKNEHYFSLWSSATADEVASKCVWAISHKVERVYLPFITTLLPILRVLPVPWFLRLMRRPVQAKNAS